MSLTSKGHFKIGSTEFAAQGIEPSFTSLASEDSGRTDDGVMHITWIKSKLRKWEITLPPTTASTLSSLFSLVQGQTYNLTIFDVTTGSEQTVHCYTSEGKASCYSGVVQNGLWQNASFSAIEMGD